MEQYGKKRILCTFIKRKKIVIIWIAALIMCGMQSGIVLYASEGMNVEYHNEGEIKAYYNSLRFYDGVTYSQTPVTTSPYAPGRLSDETMQGALETLNFIRYVAGVPYGVTLNEEYVRMVQAGTLIDAVNGRMEHTPTKPAGMSDDLFQTGFAGTSSSNLGWGYPTLVATIKDGWVVDSDNYNISILGHRRWMLNPAMKMTGFGKTDYYVAMYVFDSFGAATDYYGIAWPAQVMPTSYFAGSSPWSITMGYEVDYNSVHVKLTLVNTGRTWSFSSTHSDGDFYVDNQWYGMPGCIIFRPNGVSSYQPGDVYLVEMTGLRQNVSYEVKFFDLNSATASDSYSGTGVSSGQSYSTYETETPEQIMQVTEQTSQEYDDTYYYDEDVPNTETVTTETQTTAGVTEQITTVANEVTTQEDTTDSQEEEKKEAETEEETTKTKKIIVKSRINYYETEDEEIENEENKKYQKTMRRVSDAAMAVALLATLTVGVMAGVSVYRNKQEGE